jgi:quercetin dioxygenase-like cupin family protein
VTVTQGNAFVVVGLDSAGRSCVERTQQVARGAGAEFVSDALWTTAGLPPEITVARRGADEPTLEVIPTPHGSVFNRAYFPPGFAWEMHRSDSVDYGVVATGAMTLILETDEVTLAAGDCYLIPGLRHAWRCDDPAGAVLVTVLLGIGPPPA